MKTENEIDADILAIMARIQAEFPELVKYLPETPIRKMDSIGLGVSVESLADYYNSLVNLVEKYELDHPALKKIID